MEILQSAKFLFFVGQTIETCPRILIELQYSKRVRVEIGELWKEYMLTDKVDWPGKSVLDHVGRFKFQLPKRKEREWETAGKEADDIHQDFYRFKMPPRQAYPVTLHTVRKIHNGTMCELTFSQEEKVFHYFHPGRYVNIYPQIKGKRLKTAFYPTITFPYYNLTYPNKHPTKYEMTNRPLRVLVNTYGRNNSLQYRLCNNIPEESTIYVSYPKGTFCPTFLYDSSELQILVESVGIGPAMSVALYALQTMPDIIVNVLYFYKSERDIIYREEVEGMAKQETRFRVQFIYKYFRPDQVEWRETVKPSFLKKYLHKWSGQFGITAGDRNFAFAFADWLQEEFKYPNQSVFRFLTV